MSEPDDAVHAYKKVIDELNTAATALREREHRQAEVLQRRLEELATAAAEAEERAALARLGVELQWDAVVDRLWHESWMTLKAHPRPAPDADPADLDANHEAAVRAADELHAAVRRRMFGLGR